MNLHASGFIFLFVSSLMSWMISSVAVAAPAQLTYQGRILKTDGTPLTYNNVSFIFQIKGGVNEQCLIYQEQVSGIDLSNSAGVFEVPIGTGTVSYPTTGSFTILDAFNNSTPAFACGSCSVVGATITCAPSGSLFNPASDDTRTLKVQFFDGNGWKTISPSSVVRSVPFAGYALSAQKLGANIASDFVLKSDVNNPGAGSVSCNAGNFLTWDATTGKFGCAGVSGASGGTVTSVLASAGSNPYLTVTADPSSPVITLNVGTVAGTVAAGNDSRLVNALQPGAAAGGDLSGTYPNPSVAKIQSTAVSATAPNGAGQVLRYNGTTQYVATFLNLSDIRSSVTPASTAFPATSCTAKQTLTWISLNDTLACTAIAIDDTQIAFTTSRAANTVLAAPSGGAGAASFRTLTAADLPITGATGVYANGGNSFGTAATLGTNDNNSLTIRTNNTDQVTIATDGKVGIGAATPEFKLSLAGDGGILATGTYGAGATLATAGAGTRMIWYPRKASFRAGAASGTEWDDAQIGNYSTALGYSTKASGNYSAAFGNGTIASGNFSTATGLNSQAMGVGSVSMGVSNLAGPNYSVAIGNMANANAENSVSLGYGTNASTFAQITIGTYNANIAGNTTAFVAADPIFVIGNGASSGARSNAVTVLKNGNVGIGTIAPTAALHLKAGTATANTAPLKLTSGVNLSALEAGAIEYDGTNLYFTDSTPARRTIATTSATTYSGVSSISNSAGNITLAPNAATGSVLVTSTTASTGSADGALVVSGGAGFAGDIYSAASINAATTMSALTSILTPQLYGSASASGNIKIDGTSHATKGNVLLASTGGYVGIGTATPTKILDIQAAGTFVGPSVGITNTAGGGSTFPGLDISKYGGVGQPRIRFGNYGGTFAAPTATASGNTLGNIDFLGYGDTGLYYSAAIRAVSEAVFTDASTPASIRFLTTSVGANSQLERMRIDPSGNVGIGTTTPTGTLQVTGGTAAAATDGSNITLTPQSAGAGAAQNGGSLVVMPGAGSGTGYQGGFYVGTAPIPAYKFRVASTSQTTLAGFEYIANNSSGAQMILAKYRGGALSLVNNDNLGILDFSGRDNTGSMATGARIFSNVDGTPATGQTPANLVFQTAQNGTGTLTERMRISSTGKVGIGLNPAYLLDISNNVSLAANTYYQIARFSDGNTGKGLDFGYQANAGATGIQNAYITASAGDLTLGTNGLPEAVRVQATTGNMAIGTQNPGAKLDVADTGTVNSAIIVPRAAAFTGTAVNGMVRYNTTSTLFEFRQNGAWVNYTTVSDGRLKTNVVSVQQGLDIVNQLNPVFYDWDRTNPKSKDFAPKHQVGFIAQEVEKVLPEVVNQGEDTYRSVEYGKIVAVVVAAVKELYRSVTQVESRVHQLEESNQHKDREITSLKERIDRIEKALLKNGKQK